jgi:hypothetical protein
MVCEHVRALHHNSHATMQSVAFAGEVVLVFDQRAVVLGSIRYDPAIR